tara:strand:- start:882 stop:1265 length:384 start_codon:yes stop_codon:yes gene_type:complete
MPINSRQKGARFERYLALWFRDQGYDSFRGCQFSGKNVHTGEDAPDVVVKGVTDWLHIEAKHVEKLNLQDAYDQSRRDAEGQGKIPCVIHKRNNTEPLITFSLEDFAKFLRGDLPPDQNKQKTKDNE